MSYLTRTWRRLNGKWQALIVQEGALADLLLVDGNPLQDIQLIVDPEENIKVIMKDGNIYKNTLK